jgi:ligand-binding sensor domain-containing protein
MINFETSKMPVGQNIIRLVLVAVLSIFSFAGLMAQGSGPSQPSAVVNAKRFFASAVDKDNNIWFLTESGIVSFNGTKWTAHNKNNKIETTGLEDMAYNSSPSGSELWLATHHGATSASLPVDEQSAINTFQPENSKILSGNVKAIAAGKGGLMWFGTDKGISAVKLNKWMKNDYADKYPESLFESWPITSLAATLDGDSLYIATKGGGVLRVFRNSDVDAVSGASEYAAWGPILMPSDTVYCIHISSDGAQWFGTDKGVARHIGFKTLEGWQVFTKEDGLSEDYVQSVNSDGKGNIFLGTRKGLTVLNGTKWTTYTTDNGLTSNNILSIAIDKNGSVWLGTDNGVTCFKEGKFISFR